MRTARPRQKPPRGVNPRRQVAAVPGDGQSRRRNRLVSDEDRRTQSERSLKLQTVSWDEV
jgi:hypothetical protein